MLVLGFPDHPEAARQLSVALNATFEAVDIHVFPDGESRLRLPPDLPRDVVIYRSLHHPNDKLVELMLAADTARELGARNISLVAPYLCYMRQDKAFAPGQAVSQQIIGAHLARHFDAVITVDPHLHRVHHLAEAVPAKRAIALSAADVMGAFLHKHTDRPVLLGPDEESRQWVQAIAGPFGLEYGIADKQRSGDHEVRITLPEINITGRHVVLVDDMASTGRTLGVAAKAALEQGAIRVDALITHALFAGDAVAYLMDSGISRLWSTDSIPHESNVIGLAELIAGALR